MRFSLLLCGLFISFVTHIFAQESDCEFNPPEVDGKSVYEHTPCDKGKMTRCRTMVKYTDGNCVVHTTNATRCAEYLLPPPCKGDFGGSKWLVPGYRDCHDVPCGDDPTSGDGCTASTWSEWSACSLSCGGGKSQRIRTIINQTAAVCNLQTIQIDNCNSFSCNFVPGVVQPPQQPGVCIMGTWSQWSVCSSNCSGTQKRERVILKGTSGCPATIEMRLCGTDCGSPNDCEVSEWSVWTPCSKSCGAGMKTRSRQVFRQATAGGRECPPTVEALGCMQPPCDNTPPPPPVPYKVCHQCNTSCCMDAQPGLCLKFPAMPCLNKSSNARFKVLKGANLGEYSYKEYMDADCTAYPDQPEIPAICNICMGLVYLQCPVEPTPPPSKRPLQRICSQCNSTCCFDAKTDTCAPFPQASCLNKGTGARYFIASNQDATFNYYEFSHPHCMLENSIPLLLTCDQCSEGLLQAQCGAANDSSLCVTSDWGVWTDCTSTCGIGTQTRTRTIIRQGIACPITTEDRSCVNPPCNAGCQGTAWSPWSACSKTCGGGSQTRVRSVTSPQPDCPTAESMICNIQDCPAAQLCQVSQWGPWTQCTASCGGGTRTRTRFVISAGDSACPLLVETAQCESSPCPGGCVLGPWSEFTKCPVTCGQGIVTRSRTIIQIATNGGAACGVTMETKRCMAGPCGIEGPYIVPEDTSPPPSPTQCKWSRISAICSRLECNTSLVGIRSRRLISRATSDCLLMDGSTAVDLPVGYVDVFVQKPPTVRCAQHRYICRNTPRDCQAGVWTQSTCIVVSQCEGISASYRNNTRALNTGACTETLLADTQASTCNMSCPTLPGCVVNTTYGTPNGAADECTSDSPIRVGIQTIVSKPDDKPCYLRNGPDLGLKTGDKRFFAEKCKYTRPNLNYPSYGGDACSCSYYFFIELGLPYVSIGFIEKLAREIKGGNDVPGVRFTIVLHGSLFEGPNGKPTFYKLSSPLSLNDLSTFDFVGFVSVKILSRHERFSFIAAVMDYVIGQAKDCTKLIVLKHTGLGVADLDSDLTLIDQFKSRGGEVYVYLPVMNRMRYILSTNTTYIGAHNLLLTNVSGTLSKQCNKCAQVVCPKNPDTCVLETGCNKLNGMCEGIRFQNDSSPCNDNDPTTLGDRCIAGVCKGTKTNTTVLPYPGKAKWLGACCLIATLVAQTNGFSFVELYSVSPISDLSIYSVIVKDGAGNALPPATFRKTILMEDQYIYSTSSVDKFQTAYSTDALVAGGLPLLPAQFTLTVVRTHLGKQYSVYEVSTRDLNTTNGYSSLQEVDGLWNSKPGAVQSTDDLPFVPLRSFDIFQNVDFKCNCMQDFADKIQNGVPLCAIEDDSVPLSNSKEAFDMEDLFGTDWRITNTTNGLRLIGMNKWSCSIQMRTGAKSKRRM